MLMHTKKKQQSHFVRQGDVEGGREGRIEGRQELEETLTLVTVAFLIWEQL